MKIAIIHDWLVTYAGAEKVLESILDLYPEADLFSVVDFIAEKDRDFLKGRRPVTTFIQRLPLARKFYRHYLPLMPLAIEQLDVSKYDLIISSSHAVAKGVLTGPDQVHVCYIHSPMRYAWDLQHQYLKESGREHGIVSFVMRWLLQGLRNWDVRSSFGVDVFIANSQFIRRRVFKAYRRDSIVVYPPVDLSRFKSDQARSDFYLTASRLVPYKMVPLIAKAFSLLPHLKLVIVGDGPDMPRLRAVAGENVTVLGRVDDAKLTELMQTARAFVFAAEEDFGITPVEAQAAGCPVIAYARGGSLETVRGQGEKRTGYYFYEQTEAAIMKAVSSADSELQSISA
jgi:glycosyltransferase involved in cell wall biosynthesis